MSTAIPTPKVLSWPLGGINADGRMSYVEDDDSVREVMRNILLTRPGERIMRAKFGAGLTDFVHQPNNETTRNLMAGVVKKAIEQWETRVVVETVEVLPDRTSLSTVQINIRYRMRFTHIAKQLTFGLDLSGF